MQFRRIIATAIFHRMIVDPKLSHEDFLADFAILINTSVMVNF